MRYNINEVVRIVNIVTGELLEMENVIFALIEGEDVVVELMNGDTVLLEGGSANASLKRLARV